MPKETPATTESQRLQPGQRQPVNAAAWWRETRAELRKVTWPTGEQTRNLTVVVIAVCVVMSIFLFLVDTVLTLIVQKFIGIG